MRTGFIGIACRGLIYLEPSAGACYTVVALCPGYIRIMGIAWQIFKLLHMATSMVFLSRVCTGCYHSRAVIQGLGRRLFGALGLLPDLWV